MAGTSGLTPGPDGIARQVDALLPDAPVAVALSGGADSAVCAWAAAAAGRKVRAISVDHGLPGSGDLVDAAAAIAAQLGITHSVTAVPVGSNEGELRRLRYKALEESARPDEVLVTGHTADDQAETVLGNLLRGAGAAGLAGIPPQRGRWYRPLLGFTRDEVRAAAGDLGLPFADDPDNVSTDVRRSRIRVEAIPYLEGRFNPAVREALRRSGRLAADDDGVLEARAAGIPVLMGPGGPRVPAAALTTVPVAVASRVVRRMLRAVFDPYAGGSGDVDAVLEVANGVTARASLSGGWLVDREGASVVLHSEVPLEAPTSAELPVPGRVRIGGWTFSADPADTRPRPSPLGRWVAVISAGSGSLTLRAVNPGDTIAMEVGSKRVVDALREAGVPARLRSTWPALERSGTMLWLVGARLAPQAVPEAGAPVVVVKAEVPG